MSHCIYYLKQRYICYAYISFKSKIYDILQGSSDGWCTCPSCLCPSLVGCKLLKWDVPGPSSLVWWVHGQPFHEWLASTSLQLCPSFYALMCWHRSANELHVVTQASSTLLLVLAAALSKYFSISSTLEKNLSKISSSSDLVVRQWCTECDHKQLALSFHLWRWYAVSWCLGRSCPNPP